MKVVSFDSVHVSVPIKDNETQEEIEDKFIDAVDSISEGVVMSYKTSVEECDEG